MIENILVRKNVSLKLKITVKSLISVGIVALAVILPQLVHLAAGQAGGVQWLPMYLPVLIGSMLTITTLVGKGLIDDDIDTSLFEYIEYGYPILTGGLHADIAAVIFKQPVAETV